MSNSNSGVSIFSFTSRISNAKLQRYTMSTERGMNSTLSSSHANAEPDSMSADSTTPTEPQSKKRKFKLNGPRRQSDDADTIAVKPQPPRFKEFKYSNNMVMTAGDRAEAASATIETSQPPGSPAPSSGLSSLESAPPSERAPSPFVDPEPASSKNDYGDFMSYYVAGGDEVPEPSTEASTKKNKAAKVASKAAPKPAKSTPKPRTSKAPTPASQPPLPKPPPQLQQQHPQSQPQPQPQPQVQQDRPVQHVQGPLPSQRQAPPPQQPPPGVPRPQHGSPAFPPGVPQNHPSMQGHPQPRTAPVPQPIFQFSDIVHRAKPAKPDTVAMMIKKLHDLSLALRLFGGQPSAPPPKSSSPPPTSSRPSAPAVPATDPNQNIDVFLSLFDGGEDVLDQVLDNAGTLDGPLTHGINFIQNALKSWAQQRMSQEYTQQYHQQLQSHQQSANQKRGPGRPRKFDEPVQMLPLSPVIQMDLAQTPEGHAIKAFQDVLNSECLRVNVRLPVELANALRELYMQIDLLINQGERAPPADWQCMSYGAQIAAHRVRVDRFKEYQAKVHEETQRQQSIAHHNTMTQMGLPPQQHYPRPGMNAELAREIDLETRRAHASAHAQPYIRQQHLNPLQLGIHQSGPHPTGPPSSIPPSGFQVVPSQPRPASAGPSNSKGDSTIQMMPQHGGPTPQGSSSPGVQLDKMKMYVPGYLPRSGQNMKFSFAPHSDAAVHAFGAKAFPSTENSGPNLPNREPMSAPPIRTSSPPTAVLSGSSTAGDRPTTVPTSPDAKKTDVGTTPGRTEAGNPVVKPLTPAAIAEQAPNGNFRAHQRAQTPVVVTHGFTAVNAPAARARTSSIPVGSPTDTSPETIKVAVKKPTGSLMSAVPTRSSSKRSASEMNGLTETVTLAPKLRRVSAVGVDQ